MTHCESGAPRPRPCQTSWSTVSGSWSPRCLWRHGARFPQVWPSGLHAPFHCGHRVSAHWDKRSGFVGTLHRLSRVVDPWRLCGHRPRIFPNWSATPLPGGWLRPAALVLSPNSSVLQASVVTFPSAVACLPSFPCVFFHMCDICWRWWRWCWHCSKWRKWSCWVAGVFGAVEKFLNALVEI